MTVQILLKYYNKCCLCIYYFRAHELCKSKIMFCYTKHRLVQMPTQDVSVLEMHVLKSIQGRAPWWRSNLYHGYHLPVVQYSCLRPEKLKKTQKLFCLVYSAIIAIWELYLLSGIQNFLRILLVNHVLFMLRVYVDLTWTSTDSNTIWFPCADIWSWLYMCNKPTLTAH